MVAHLSKCVGQQGAVAFIDADVRRQVTAFRRHPLKQAGGIDISLRAACTCRRRVNGISVRHLLGDQHIAQPLAREGKGLGKGVADDGVLVDLRYPGDLHAVEGNLPVRLVGDQIDGVAVERFLSPEDRCQSFQRLAGVDHAGGVVGGVDDHALGAAGDCLFKGGKVDLKVLRLRGDHLDLPLDTLDKHPVLRKVGGKEDVLVAGAGQSAQYTAERRRRAYGEVQLVRRILLPKPTVQGVSNPLSGGGIAGGAGVAVNRVCLFPQQPDGGLIHLYGSGDAGVSQ